LLDLHLPDGEGIQLITQLKQQVPEMPVVILTGVQDEEIAAAALQEGAQDYVLKSDTFSSVRLSQLGATDLGNWLVRRIQYAVKRAETNKQREIDQARYALINQGMQEGVWDWDLQGNTVYLSPQWTQLLGIYNRCEAPTETSTKNNISRYEPSKWLSRIHPEDKPRFDQTLQIYLQHRQPQFYCEYRIQHTEGHYIWVLTKGKALWDAAGVAYRIVGSQSDITARKRQEESAYHRRELAQTTLHSVGAGLLSLQATLYTKDGLYEEAEPLLACALSIQKALLGNEHPDVAVGLYNLAALYDNQFRFKEAELLFREALAIFQSTFGSSHPHTQKISTKVDMICRMNKAIKKAHVDQPDS
ncbi:MAG: tetratricopeptide repeat protein, partial [Cyanobacteria bacterium J06560_2]